VLGAFIRINKKNVLLQKYDEKRENANIIRGSNLLKNRTPTCLM